MPEVDNIGKCTTCGMRECKCDDIAWLRTRLKQIRDHKMAGEESLKNYSFPDICFHCGEVIRKGHTEWFHFDGTERISRFCNNGSGKMAEPTIVTETGDK